MDSTSGTSKQPRLWPFLVAAGVLLGIILAVLFMMKEVNRVRSIREFNPAPSPGLATNGSPGLAR